uniref:Methyltransferase n=1 Tax=viral metagenome TaxID=1070528 RepID=A0A6C0EUX5_9ZZZZ
MTEQAPAFLCKTTTSKAINYIKDLESLSDKNVADFALYTPINSTQRFLARYELMKLIQNIPGAVIEMGVCSGNGLMSLIHSHNIIQPTYQYREFYGFDTFEGFPSVHENDISDVNWEKGDFANNSFDKLKKIIDIHNNFFYVPTKVNLIKGDATQTIPEFLKDNRHVIISLLYLDMDIYEPTKVALKEFLPRMAKGSIIAFDELNWKSFPGETIATLEELGTKYKFVNLLNSQINYCVIE